jgi:hypothetical protein
MKSGAPEESRGGPINNSDAGLRDLHAPRIRGVRG